MPKHKSKEDLLKEVHETPESLAKIGAERWTIENSGQTWPYDGGYGRFREDVITSAAEDDVDDVEAGLNEELAEWRAHALGLAQRLSEAQIELTLDNLELAFDRKIP